MRNVRSAKERSRTGSVRDDNVRRLLKSHQNTQLMCKLKGRFVQGQILENIVAAVGLGRMTALVKQTEEGGWG